MTIPYRLLSRCLRREPLFAFVLLVAGCAHKDTEQPADSAATTPAPADSAEPAPASSQEHFDRAIALLQTGEAMQAKEELKSYLSEVPDSKPARELLAEIETPLEKLYPRDSFTVVLSKNETLSEVAARYLGDSLAFYGLARFNNISEPAKVAAGQRIRIPRKAVTATNERQADAAGAAVEIPPLRITAPSESPDMRGVEENHDAAADRSADFSATYKEGGFVEAAHLADGGHLDRNKVGAAKLATAWLHAAELEKQDDPASAAVHARKAGTVYLELKDPERARAAFSLALAVSPDDAAARAGLDKATAWLATTYYRQATACFQRQDLDGAIRAWDRLLAIKPGDRDAQLNRAQAMQLKANLQKLRG